MNKNDFLEQNPSLYSDRERFRWIRNYTVDKSVLLYLKDLLHNLSIEIGHKEDKNIFDLMEDWTLEGWCWQTTASAIVFFNDNDCIERGNLKFGYNKYYWHSWIIFKFENEFYVFDPCLCIIIEKDIYYHIFEIGAPIARIPAKAVKEEMICRIEHHTKEAPDITRDFLSRMVSKFSSEKAKNETAIYGVDDSAKSTMYRNSTGYTATIENGKITKLRASFYYNG